MNITMQMTVDQLVRSLRGMAHGVADRVELRPPKRRPDERRPDPRSEARRQDEEQPDERRR